MLFSFRNIFNLKLFLVLILSFSSIVCGEGYGKNNKLENLDNGKDNLTFEIKKNSSIYILGSGDVLFIDFEGLPSFTNFYNIDQEGFINLPDIERFYARGITIQELKKEILTKYDKFIINPKIDISIQRYRPVNIFIKGEVRNPGIYKISTEPLANPRKNTFLPPEPTIKALNIQNNLSADLTLQEVPRIFDALRLSGGVTNNADLANLEIVRQNSKSNGGGRIKAKINFLKLIIDGDQTYNLNLYDGDTIIVPKSSANIREQILAINKTNLNPNRITVFVTGNIINPGPLVVKKGSSLNQAIASSGGKKILTGNIEFLRFDNNGITIREKIRYKATNKINSKNNPILMDGDIINVRKTIFGNIAEVLREVGTPVFTGIGIYNIFTD